MSASILTSEEHNPLPNSLASWLLQLFDCDVRASMSMVIVFLMVFINGSDFQGADPEQFTFKWQIYMRLAVCGIAGAYALLNFNDCYQQLRKFPGAIVLMFGIWVFVSVPFSMDSTFSAVAACGLMSAILFVPVAIQHAGQNRFIVVVLIGTLLYTAISWFLYFFVPELGIWTEYLAVDEPLERMGGLGHPNALGFNISIALILAMVLWHNKRVRSWEVIIIGIVWLVTLYFCLSRTSIIISILAISAIFARGVAQRKFQSLAFVTLFGAACIGLYLAFVGGLDDIVHKAMLSVSKSGDAAEVTTVTGRSEIWQYAIQQIQVRPVTGSGYGCARFVMVDYSFHAHNIVLNAGLMTGVVGAMLIAWMMLWMVMRLFQRPDAYLRAIIVMFLASGLVESLIYDPCPSAPAVLFLSALFWPNKSAKPPSDEPELHSKKARKRTKLAYRSSSA